MNIKTINYPAFKVAIINKPEAKIASVIITADCGGENTPKTTAQAVLYADMLMSGAGKYNREEFMHALDELGASIRVSESDDKVTISVKTLAEKLPKTLTLLSAMFESPVFKPTELKRAKQTAENAIELYKEDARSLASDGLGRALYKKTDRHYPHTPEEVAKALKKVTVGDLKLHHKQVMSALWVVSVGGSKKTSEAVIKTITKIKKPFPVIKQEPALAEFNVIDKTQVITHEVSSKQNIEVSIGGYVPLTRNCPHLPAFLFGLTVLGKWGGFAGRLMSTVREKEGLTYGIYACLEGASATENSYWRIMTFFSPKDVSTGITSTLREVTKIHEKGITENELERFKTIMKTGDQLVYDSLAKTVSLVHGVLVSGVEWEDYQEFKEKLYNCSKQSVDYALKTYLDPKKIIISTAGPVKGVEKELKGFAK